jgi:hypothetical protein
MMSEQKARMKREGIRKFEQNAHMVYKVKYDILIYESATSQI